MSDFGIYEHVVTREAGKGSVAVRILLVLFTALGLLGLLWLGLITEMFFLFLAIATAAANRIPPGRRRRLHSVSAAIRSSYSVI